MKKRIAFLGSILSFIPLGQPLLIQTGVFLSTTGLILTIPENVNAESSSFYFKRGKDLADFGDYEGAINALNKEIEINPKNEDAYFYRAFYKGELEDYYGAISDYNKAVEINPKDAIAYSNRGASKELLEDLKGACDDWRKAVDLGHQSAAQWVENQCS